MFSEGFSNQGQTIQHILQTTCFIKNAKLSLKPYFGEKIFQRWQCAAHCPISLWQANQSAKAHVCCLHDTKLIFVPALVVPNNLFQQLSHHLALTQLGLQNGAQSMVDQWRKRINHRVFFSKYLIKHGGK